MKKRNWIPVLVMLICFGLFMAYRLYQRAVTDTKAPVITAQDEAGVPEISVKDENALLQGVTAQDARDGDVTGSIIVERISSTGENGQILVTYAAFDSSGNVGKLQRPMRYTDYIGPRFSLTQPLVFSYGGQYDVLNYVRAEDSMDGDIRHRIRTTQVSENALSEEGTHEILFQVTNSLGDTEALVLPVQVQYAGKYEGQLYLKQYLVYLKTAEPFDAQAYLQNVVYRGENTNLAGRVPGALKLEVNHTVDTRTPGVYTVDYTVSDAGGAWSAFSRLIVVVEG